MFRTALKSVLANKVRLGLTALAIVLGVSLVAGTFIFTDTINRQFDTLFDDIFQGVDVTVRKAGADFAANEEPFPASVIDTVRGVEGVAIVDGGVSTFQAQVLDKEGEPIGGQGPPTLGFSWGTVESLTPLTIKEGKAPTAPGEVAIDANTVATGEFAVGDRVTVVTQSGVAQFELVGVMSFGGTDTLLGATLSAWDIAEARRLFGLGDEYTSITVKAVDGVSSEELAQRVGAALPADLEAVTGQTQKNEQAEEIDTALGFINIGLLAFAGVSIFVGAYIIQNTFRIIVAQRTRELALLRAIGATARQVTRTVILEALIVGVFGSIVGIGLGFVMATAIRALMNSVGLALPEASLVLAPRTIIIGLAVGIILTLASSVLPARRASKVPPIAAMRADLARPARRDLRTRTLIGIGITGVGVLFLIGGLFTSIGNPLALVGLGAGLLFIGVSVLAPLAARPFANLLGRPAEGISGISGVLARENTKRSPRRTASTASALMIGVALVAFFTIFASSTKASIEETIADLFPADLTIQSNVQQDPELPSAFSPTVAESLRALPELAVVSPMQFGRFTINGDEKVLGAFDPATIEQAFSVKPVGNAVSAVAELNSIIVATGEMEAQGWEIGQSLAATFARTGAVTLEIVGTFEADDFSNFYIASDTYRANFSASGDGLIFANAADGVDVATAQEAAQAITDPFGTIDVNTSSDLIQSANDQIDQALTLFNGLLFIAVVIAVLGIVNTLALSVFERTREIGLLRAVGMVRRQVRQMIRWESVIIALFGALLGVIIGIFLGWAVVRALADEGFGTFAVPYGQVVLAFVLAAIAGVVAAIWPARKAAKLNVLEAIAYE